MNSAENKIKWLHVRLSEDEHSQIHKQFKKTTCRKLSEYARKILLGKPLIGTIRNRSLDDFMAEMILLRKELNAAGNNFNQAVRKLHSAENNTAILQWVGRYDDAHRALLQSVQTIEKHISKIGDIWLQ